MTDVSIIIVNFKTINLVIDCIKSIIDKTQSVSYQIIVVDNASDDNFSNILSLNFGNTITCIPLSENLGFGKANNEGLKAATGRNILFLNPDTLLVNDAISILSMHLDRNENVGACGGNLFHHDLRKAHSFRRILPGPFWEFSERFHRHPERLIYGRNTRFNHSSNPINVGYILWRQLNGKTLYS